MGSPVGNFAMCCCSQYRLRLVVVIMTKVFVDAGMSLGYINWIWSWHGGGGARL